MEKYWPKIKMVLALVLIAAAVTSCSNKRRGGIILVSNCPAVGIIGHLNTLTRFNGQGKTNKDVVFDAHISDVDVQCTEGTSVTSDISFSIRGKKGPAFQGQTYRLNYYVVLLRDNYFITNKKVYSTQLTFDPNSDTTGVRERVVQTFNSFEQPKRYDYEVLIGFEVTPEELEFNVVR